jgi:hypothetical protein
MILSKHDENRVKKVRSDGGLVLDGGGGRDLDRGVMNTMKLNTFFALVLSVLIVGGSGCVATNEGHTTPGVPFGKDSIHSKYQRPVEQLVEATKIVLTRNGKLILDNVVNNTFQARINERNVWVRITRVDDKTTAVDVQARTGSGDIELAAEIDKQIALQLTTIQAP